MAILPLHGVVTTSKASRGGYCVDASALVSYPTIFGKICFS